MVNLIAITANLIRVMKMWYRFLLEMNGVAVRNAKINEITFLMNELANRRCEG